MATYTPNLNLKKPASSEQFNIEDFNSNSDKIDTAVGNRVVKNNNIAPATKPLVTYDAKGLVTGGTDLTPAYIPNLTLAKITDAGTAASKNVGTTEGTIPVLGKDGRLPADQLPVRNDAPIVLVDGVPIYQCRFVDVDTQGRPILRADGTGDYLITVLEDGTVMAVDVITQVVDGLDGQSSTDALSAKQGGILSGFIGALGNLLTTAKNNLVEAINEVFTTITNHISNITNPHSVTKAQVGLGNADNTSDANKPISMATQTALNAKAPINNPAFTGTVGGITKTMVGLGNVTNDKQATEVAFNAHVGNKDNPHSVTAEKINAYTKDEANTLLDEKQDTLIAGANISIAKDAGGQSVISSQNDIPSTNTYAEVYVDSPTTLSGTRPATPITVPYALATTAAVARPFTLLFNTNTPISASSFYGVWVNLTSLRSQGNYILLASYAYQGTVISQGQLPFETGNQQTTAYIYIPMNVNFITQNINVTAGTSVTLTISLQRVGGNNHTVNMVSSPTIPVSFVRNGGDVSGNNVYVLYNGNLITQEAYNDITASSISFLHNSKANLVDGVVPKKELPYINQTPALYIGDTPLYGTTFADMDAQGNPVIHDDGSGDYLLAVTVLGVPYLKYIGNEITDTATGIKYSFAITNGNVILQQQ